MLSRKDSTQKYISIKEQKQNKYDNNVTIIIYNEIKLHSESNSSNLTCVHSLLYIFIQCALYTLHIYTHINIYELMCI